MAFSRPYNPPIPLSDITGLGSAAAKNAPVSGNAASGEVVLGSDTRLSDSRTPTSHNHAASEITSGTIAAARLPIGSDVQAYDATLAAIAGWAWSSGREVLTFTAADTLSVLRVGTSANNLVQLDGSGKLPAVDGSLLTGITGGASNLDGLSDVTIASPASGHTLFHNGTVFVNRAITASDIPSGVDATKIGGGSVSNTEFGYLDGVTSAIQTQLDAKQSLIAYEYSWPADVTRTYVSGTYQTIHTTPSLAVGRYRFRSNVNHTRASAAIIYQRIQAGTASLAGATNDSLGHGFAEGTAAFQIRISSTSPWTTTTVLRNSADNQATHVLDITFEVTSAGTVLLQQMFTTSADITEKKGSLIQIWKVA